MRARGAPSARTRLTLITYSMAWSTRDTAAVISAGTTAAAALPPPPRICPDAASAGITSFSDDAAVAASASVSRRLGLADVRRAGAGGAEGAGRLPRAEGRISHDSGGVPLPDPNGALPPGRAFSALTGAAPPPAQALWPRGESGLGSISQGIAAAALSQIMAGN